MPNKTVSVTKTVSAFGVDFSSDDSQSGNAETSVEVTLGAAKIGQLTTRTDANTGTLTMSGGHGITDAARLDVYWSGGRRRGMTVGTVSANSVPIDGGAGDDLPANLTAITAMVPTEVAFGVTAAGGVGLGFSNKGGANAYAIAAFCQSGGTEVLAYVLAPLRATTWLLSGDPTTPIGSNIAKVYLSHGDSAGSVKLQAFGLYN